jgi:hypothetical protein
VPWIKVPRTTYGRFRQAQRALVKRSGAISHNAAPSIWQTFDGAAEIAKQLGFNSRDGGLAYILPPLTEAASTSALFFSLPPFTIAPGPFEAALGSAAPTPPGPIAAALGADVPTQLGPFAAAAMAPGWQPAELIIASSTPASWRDVLAQLDGTYAYLQQLKTWCRLRVAREADAPEPAGRKGGAEP